MGYDDGYNWGEYVSVAERKKKAAQHIKSLQKKGRSVNPIVIEGRAIAKTFWGKAWCENLESYSDYENRLPRGRTYVRNGSVIDLQVTKGQVKAQVMGSSLYNITINVKPMPEGKWKSLVKACAGKIDSLIELLQGQFSKAVMETITQKEGGLFPKPQEISMRCSCPDYAGMCKHIAAVLYGIGATLDTNADWLFALRHVDHLDLVASANSGEAIMHSQSSDHVIEEGDLSALFGIEMDAGITSVSKKPAAKKSKGKKKVVVLKGKKKPSKKPSIPKSKSTAKRTLKKKVPLKNTKVRRV